MVRFCLSFVTCGRTWQERERKLFEGMFPGEASLVTVSVAPVLLFGICFFKGFHAACESFSQKALFLLVFGINLEGGRRGAHVLPSQQAGLK